MTERETELEKALASKEVQLVNYIDSLKDRDDAVGNHARIMADGRLQQIRQDIELVGALSRPSQAENISDQNAAYLRQQVEIIARDFLADVPKHIAENVACLRMPGTAKAEKAEVAETWKCFHCWEVFTDKDAAADHFGWSQYGESACRVDGGLAHAYRAQENELRRYREEDTDLHRAIFRLGSDAETKRREWGDKEYAQGLADGRAERPQPPASSEGGDVIHEAILEVVRWYAEDGKTTRDGWPDDLELLISRADGPEDMDFTLGDLRAYAERSSSRSPAPAEGKMVVDAAMHVMEQGCLEKDLYSDNKEKLFVVPYAAYRKLLSAIAALQAVQATGTDGVGK